MKLLLMNATKSCESKKVSAWAVVALSFFIQCQLSLATTVIPPDFAELVKDAELIFRGRVIQIKSQWEGDGETRRIVSYVKFDVLKKLKGSPSTPYELVMLGGTVGTDTLEICGAPKFNVGDESILFVEKNGTQFIPLVGIMYGHFKVAKEAVTNDDILLKSDGHPLCGTDEIDAIKRSGESTVAGSQKNRRPMRMSDFERQIEEQTKSSTH